MKINWKSFYSFKRIKMKYKKKNPIYQIAQVLALALHQVNKNPKNLSQVNKNPKNL